MSDQPAVFAGDELLTFKEAAELARRSTKTLERSLPRSIVRQAVPNGVRYVWRSDLVAWINGEHSPRPMSESAGGARRPRSGRRGTPGRLLFD